MTLPTAAMKSGDFSSWLGSQVGTDALGRPVFSNEIYDPTTTRNVTAGQVDTKTGLTANADAVIRDPFSSGGNLNIIPAAEFSNATSVLLPMILDPSLPGNINNAFRLNGCCPILSRNAYTGKIDHVLTSRQKLWGSFTWNKRDRYNRNNRSEEHTSELQSRLHLVCRLLLEKKKKKTITYTCISSTKTLPLFAMTYQHLSL